MFLSAEIRWFFEEDPRSLRSWFSDRTVHGCDPGGGPPSRTDIYLIGLGSTEIGIKVRGVKGSSSSGAVKPLRDLEIKGLISEDPEGIRSGPLRGPIQVWCKWPFKGIDIGRTKTLPVGKTRWVRKYDLSGSDPIEVPLDKDESPINGIWPSRGCNVEFTEVFLPDGSKRFSLGLESFGDRSALEDGLRSISSHLEKKGIPDPEIGRIQSYPEWMISM